MQEGDDDAFFVFDVNNLMKQHQMWTKNIPQVKPFYAVKCNDSDVVLKVLSNLGTGFDCASKIEIQKVLSLGVPPEKIIFAHTTKQISHIAYARKFGVKKMTFDSLEELLKIERIFPEAELVLRIRFDAQKAEISFGKKFGCDPITEAPHLINACKGLNLNLIGISFHGGSFSDDAFLFTNALRMIRFLFDFSAKLGIEMSFVDIGGGFIGNDEDLMTKYARDINRGVARYFADKNYEIISEPGRFFMASAFTLVCNVIAKKERKDSNGQPRHIEYFINDGVFSSFLGKFLGKTLAKQTFEPLDAHRNKTLYTSTIWGQTCDIVDQLAENILLPQLHVDDWLLVKNMGSYTSSAATRFNGFEERKIYPVWFSSS